MKCPLSKLKYPIMTFMSSHVQHSSPTSIELMFTGCESLPSRIVYSMPKALVFQFWRDDKLEMLVEDMVHWIQMVGHQDKCLDWTVAKITVLNSHSTIANEMSMVIRSNKDGILLANYSNLPSMIETSFQHFSSSQHLYRVTEKGATTVPKLSQICAASLPWDSREYISQYLHLSVNVMESIAWVSNKNH